MDVLCDMRKERYSTCDVGSKLRLKGPHEPASERHARKRHLGCFAQPQRRQLRDGEENGVSEDQTRNRSSLWTRFQPTLRIGRIAKRNLPTLWRNAEDLINQASRLDGRSAKVIRYQGLLREAMGNKQAATERYLAAIRRDASYGTAYADLGRILEGQQALRYLHKAVECNPEDAWAHYRIAIASKGDGTNTFTEHLLLAESLYPNDQDLLIVCARAALSAGLTERAKKIYNQVIAINKSNVDALVGLGRIYIEAGRWEEGLLWIDDAARANPTDSHPYAMVAAIYADQGNAEKSLEYCRRAVEIDPSRRVEGDTVQEMIAAMHSLLSSPKPEALPIALPQPTET